jgi:rhamnosyltransferase
VNVVEAKKDTAKIVVVAVTYNPDTAKFLAQMMAIARMDCEYIIVDNGSSAAFKSWLASHAIGGVQVIWLESNRGIAVAQNVGIGAARKFAGSHVLLLDHDSVPHPEMAGALLRAMNDKVAQGLRVAAVGPRWGDFRPQHAASFVRIGWFGYRKTDCGSATQGAIEADLLLSSGMLIGMNALDAIGPMREEFFIDHVDTDWCLRARTAGWSLYGVCNAVLDHALGERAVRIWIGRKRSLHVHSPERLYYYMRNAIALARLDSTPVRWCLAELPRLCGLAVAYVGFVSPRIDYLRMICRGVCDGLAGRMGALKRA